MDSRRRKCFINPNRLFLRVFQNVFINKRIKIHLNSFSPSLLILNLLSFEQYVNFLMWGKITHSMSKLIFVALYFWSVKDKYRTRSEDHNFRNENIWQYLTLTWFSVFSSICVSDVWLILSTKTRGTMNRNLVNVYPYQHRKCKTCPIAINTRLDIGSPSWLCTVSVTSLVP